MGRSDAVWNAYYAPFVESNRERENENVRRSQTIERMYQRVLTELCVNRFKWYGLPDSIDPRFLELTLFRNALSVFYYDSDYSQFMALKGSASGQVNYMDNPTAFLVTGNQFVGKTLSAIPRQLTVGGEPVRMDAECVPIWANYLRYPDVEMVSIFASRLADLDRTIEINAHNARRSKILVTDENGSLTSVNINRAIDEGSPAIRLSSAGMNMLPTAHDMGVDPRSIEPLDILRVRQLNSFMTLAGISNANQDKKERLVEAEVGANDEQTDLTKAVNLNARKQAARDINKRYGLSISVEYNTDIDKQVDAMLSGDDMSAALTKIGVAG